MRNQNYILLVVFLFVSCTHKHEKPPVVLVATTEKISLSVSEIIQDQLEQYLIDSLLIIDDDTLQTSQWIYNMFAQNDFLPLWSNEQKLNVDGLQMLNTIDSASFYGLIPDDYRNDILKQKILSVYDSTLQKINATTLYEINILLTDAYFNMAVHIRKGKLDADSLTPVWKGFGSDSLMHYTLNDAMEKHNIKASLDSLEPKLYAYKMLKNQLDSLIKLSNPIVSDTLKVIKNDTINIDSINELRVQQVMMNMERCRWEKPRQEKSHLDINIPSYTLKFYDDDTLVFESSVIIGKYDTQTPWRLNSKITHFYIYPYWNVPYSIATKEILPKLKKDTNYLAKHKMDVLNSKGEILNPSKIKWKKYSEKHFPYKIRQRDGDDNTLGILKFIFSNKYGVYLHDTSTPSLFKKSKRALSHGCIRLEKTKQLAEYLVTNERTVNFNIDSLNENIKNKQRKKVDLVQPLPIHIRYYTCEADSTGIKFYNDIYKLDKKMMDNFFIRKKFEALVQN